MRFHNSKCHFYTFDDFAVKHIRKFNIEVLLGIFLLPAHPYSKKLPLRRPLVKIRIATLDLLSLIHDPDLCPFSGLDGSTTIGRSGAMETVAGNPTAPLTHSVLNCKLLTSAGPYIKKIMPTLKIKPLDWMRIVILSILGLRGTKKVFLLALLLI